MMNFGNALTQMSGGSLVQRQGWTGCICLDPNDDTNILFWDVATNAWITWVASNQDLTANDWMYAQVPVPAAIDPTPVVAAPAPSKKGK